MSRFSCICGEVTHEVDEPADASLVAYPSAAMLRTRREIAELIAAYVESGDAARREEWLRRYLGEPLGHDQPLVEIAELIVNRELNVGFLPIFRCPHCGRIALSDPETGKWEFFARG